MIKAYIERNLNPKKIENMWNKKLTNTDDLRTENEGKRNCNYECWKRMCIPIVGEEKIRDYQTPELWVVCGRDCE